MVAAASLCSIYDVFFSDNFLVLSIFSSSLLEGGKTSASELSWWFCISSVKLLLIKIVFIDCSYSSSSCTSPKSLVNVDVPCLIWGFHFKHWGVRFPNSENVSSFCFCVEISFQDWRSLFYKGIFGICFQACSLFTVWDVCHSRLSDVWWNCGKHVDTVLKTDWPYFHSIWHGFLILHIQSFIVVKALLHWVLLLVNYLWTEGLTLKKWSLPKSSHKNSITKLF